ncbi:MAG: hypothetical protein U5Q44_09560 [Dehalococcoidia bacterium]|nr:hypothetical protein [Dehalococcoidia bacterium]
MSMTRCSRFASKVGGELQDGEGCAGIADGAGDELLAGIGRQLKAECGDSTLVVRERPVDEGRDVVIAKGLEVQDADAAEKGRHHFEGGVLGRGADEGHGSVLDMGEDDVLLGLVEAMDLVDEEHGAAAGGALISFPQIAWRRASATPLPTAERVTKRAST